MRTLLINLLLRLIKGGDIMATIYVTLIVKGYKTYQQVPDILKTEVKNQLEALELGELAR
jgi:hypothetical protein